MTKPKPLITVIKTGLITYRRGLQIQKLLTQQSAEPCQEFRNHLVLQEFHPVYTIGIRTKGYTDKDEQKLINLGAEFYRTNRGGLITFHGPGQLVAYPLVHLKQFTPSMRWYVATLEHVVIETCKRMGISNATTTKDTGIWVNNRKICAIGVHGSRYITTHGIGFNCSTDLTWFDHIVPCGIEGKGVTSLTQELQRKVSVKETGKQLLTAFADIFQCDISMSTSLQTQEILQKASKI